MRLEYRESNLKSKSSFALEGSILFSISIDQFTQTGEYFQSMVDTIIETIDHQQHLTLFLPWKIKTQHFLALGTSNQEALQAAKALYHQWINDNQRSIARLQLFYGNNFSILTDETIMNTSLFIEKSQNIDHFYKTNSAFRHSVKNLSKNYTKNKIRFSEGYFEEACNAMANYLLQQSTLVVTLSYMPFSYEIYPGKNRAHAMEIALKKFGDYDQMTFVPLEQNMLTFPSKLQHHFVLQSSH